MRSQSAEQAYQAMKAAAYSLRVRQRIAAAAPLLSIFREQVPKDEQVTSYALPAIKTTKKGIS